ncbi:MAG: hypothetical protein SEPTF4163_001319 [Sporothrix epigloea]
MLASEGSLSDCKRLEEIDAGATGDAVRRCILCSGLPTRLEDAVTAVGLTNVKLSLYCRSSSVVVVAGDLVAASPGAALVIAGIRDDPAEFAAAVAGIGISLQGGVIWAGERSPHGGSGGSRSWPDIGGETGDLGSGQENSLGSKIAASTGDVGEEADV